MFYLTMYPTHFIYGYMASNMTIQQEKKPAAAPSVVLTSVVLLVLFWLVF